MKLVIKKVMRYVIKHFEKKIKSVPLYLCSITFLLTFSIRLSYAQQTSEAFIVTIKDTKISVTSPAKKQKTIGLIIKNETFDKIISEVRSEKGVIKRFVLKPQSNETLEIDYYKINTLYYVAIAPPAQAVELKFSQRAYEIPEKK